MVKLKGSGAGVVATILTGPAEVFEGSKFLPRVAPIAAALGLGVVVQCPVTVATQKIALEQFD